ncbi:MAG: light-harvesting protein [Alphaproteobacteria bacterium]|nr:light-harvesting protein [Alphaproteobacteria bacterium]
MWRIWQLFGVRTIMVALYAWLGFLAIMIHLILLSTDRYNWLEQKSYTKTGSVTIEGPATTKRLAT